jgi:hypothetical protein
MGTQRAANTPGPHQLRGIDLQGAMTGWAMDQQHDFLKLGDQKQPIGLRRWLRAR